MVSSASNSFVHVAQHMQPLGGLETLVLDLMRTGERADWCISLEGSQAELTAAPNLASYAPRIIGMNKRAGLDVALIGRLARTLRTLKPRSVVAHHIGPLLYAGLAGRLAGISRLVYYEHDTWHYQRANDRRIARLCTRLFKPRLVAVSSVASREMKDILGDVEIRVLPPGVDMQRFNISDVKQARQRLGLPEDGRIIGSAGRLALVKGHRFLVDALADMPKSYRLVLLGDGSERSNLEAQAGALGLSERVHFLGHRCDVESVLPALDLFCLPSLAEGLPRALIEAQACGLPVVATDVGGVRSAVAAGGGEIVAPANASALAAACVRVIADHAPAEAIRASVAERFSLEIVHTVLEELSA